MQVAQAQATFCACLRRGPIAPILLVRTEHDSAGHGDLDASSSGAAGLESALKSNASTAVVSKLLTAALGPADEVSSKITEGRYSRPA
jgi:hypothetical protein